MELQSFVKRDLKGEKNVVFQVKKLLLKLEDSLSFISSHMSEVNFISASQKVHDFFMIHTYRNVSKIPLEFLTALFIDFIKFTCNAWK